MSDGTGIEWCDATWNPILGCSKVSAGCKNCYAVKQVHRQKGRHPGLTVARPGGVEWTGEVKLLEERLNVPLGWRMPRRVFVNSLSDLFHEAVPEDFIAKVFAVMASAPQHRFQVLTKRPENMAALLVQWGEASSDGRLAWDAPSGDGEVSASWPLPNVWLGTSVENQAAADERIPHLVRTPAAVRFLSCEPLLGPVDLLGTDAGGVLEACNDCDDGSCEACGGLGRVHWVIVGGESGPGARPFELAWARGIVQQCREAGVAVFVKQLGARPVLRWAAAEVAPVELRDRKGGDMAEWPADLRVRQFPEVAPRA